VVAGDVATGPTPGPPFAPQWEVDAFPWPAISAQLQRVLQPVLGQVLETLLERCGPHRNVLVMTSRQRSEGRTTMLLEIARAAAERGLKVALIDGDLAHPQLSQQLGVTPEVGLESVLAGSEALAASCIASSEQGIVLLPLGRPQDDPPGAWPRVAAAATELARHHDLVLVDAGPLGTGARHLHGHAAAGDMGAILVHDARSTSRQQVQGLAGGVRETGLWLAGVIENFAA
jgi:Mrp family chromosome partitioning ATPase